MITIREATAADSKAIADLTQELGYAASPPSTRRRLAELQSSDNDIVLVATLSRSVVGWIHVQRVALLESDVFGEIKGLVVTEAQRGTGVGSQLVEAAEAWAREHSCPRLRVRSNVVRTEARRFYENRGFAVTKVQNVFEKPLGHTSRSGRITKSRSR